MAVDNTGEGSTVSLRDYFAAHAPVTVDDVLAFSGYSQIPQNDNDRKTFFFVWSLLKYEYADAMLQKRAWK